LTAGLLGGVLGFFLLVMLSMVFQFLSTLQLLETPPPGPITPFENWIYQLVFVAITEEMFFRQNLAYIVSEFFLRRFMGPDRARQVSLIFIMAIAFGVIHFAAYELNFWNIFNACVAGAILGFIRYGWPKKKNGSIVYKEIEIEGTVIQAKQYLFGGFFASYLAHLMYNTIMLTQLLIIHF
jgi:membrane protease YdiL (CAAX protease family)